MQAAAKAVERAQTDALKDVGETFKRAAVKAVAADLTVTGTPTGFSGWRRGQTVPLEVSDKPVRQNGFVGVLVEPSRRAKGPWRVAESGRKLGVHGPSLTKSGKVRKTRARRYAGESGGKDTWSDTVDLAAKDLPKKIRSEVVTALKGVFQ